MGFLDRVLPGRRAPVDVKDAQEKTRIERQDAKVIYERTETLERLFFVDDLFPPVNHRKKNGKPVWTSPS